MAVSQDFLPFTRPSIDEQTISAVGEVLRSGWITSGPQVREFEAQLSAYCGGRPVRVMSSGTDALEIGLALVDVGPGDEVITSPLSWVATANVIVRAGARPVFVDVDPLTRNMDLALIETALSPRTRMFLPVDLAGLPVDRERLYAIAREHSLRVLEDAAQSMGSTWGGERIGATGDLVAISFHANKNITTAEGGCLVLNDAEEAKCCELWRLQGVERFADGGLDGTPARGIHVAPARSGAPLLRALRPLARLRAAARGLRAQQLAHVSDRAARAHRARRFHPRHACRRHRRRRALSGDSSVVVLPQHGLQAGRVPACRTHRPRHRHAAIVSGDARAGRG